MNIAKIATEASKILKDYPDLTYKDAIGNAKEVIECMKYLYLVNYLISI